MVSLKATKDGQVFLRDLPTHTPSPLVSLMDNLICPKIRMLGGNCRWNCLDAHTINRSQRGGSCDGCDWVCKRVLMLLRAGPTGCALFSQGCRQFSGGPVGQPEDWEHSLLHWWVKSLRSGHIRRQNPKLAATQVLLICHLASCKAKNCKLGHFYTDLLIL